VPHVLVVEDDPQVRAALLRTLAERGYAVSSAGSGLAGLQAAVAEQPDLVLLDLGLPDLDGAEVLRMLRAVSQVPVIVVTARDEETEIVAGLERGADDYLVKPFGTAQLDARIRAVLRRSTADEPAAEITIGGLVLDPGGRQAWLDGVPLDLAPKEFDLLRFLVERAGQVVSKRELLAEVWRLPLGSADKTVDAHLSWLRRKLGETAHRPRYLHTVRGVGIRLVAPDEG
jgi:two-component system, OmpR family, response regulator PrrA